MAFQLSDVCVEVSFPFGIQVSGSATAFPSPGNDPMRQLMVALHAAIAPFMPAMKIADLLKSVVDALQAIPSCITSLSPTKLVKKLKEVAEKLAAVLSILPPAAVPPLVRDMCSVLALYLAGVRAQLLSLRASAQVSLDLRATADQLTLDGQVAAAAEIVAIIDQATAQNVSALATLSAQSCPYNHLVGVLVTLAKLVHLPSPPTLDFGAGDGVQTPEGLTVALDAGIGAINTGLSALALVQNVVGTASFGGSASAIVAG